jgi:Ca2+-binding EF-hand superfamily protein
MMLPSINSALKKRLVEETNMEAEEIEALYDQFTCLAATEWQSDPSGVGWAMDRRCFNHAFIPKFSSFDSAPNLIYDRVFAYFDTDHNTLIGLEEFIKGIDGLHSTDLRVKLRIVFNGYDVDGDGYISRKDVLRIFRAHYVMEKEATRNHLIEAEDELSVRGALATIHSSQPLGSAFTQSSMPTNSPDTFRLQDKSSEDENFQHPIVEDDPDTMDRNTLIRRTYHLGNPYFRARSGDEAVRERWAQRDYYVDEEEGFTRPPGVEDGPSPHELEAQTDEDTNETQAPDHERPRGSRSSSRVRFQDDVDLETRSNASTSSRPIGERWGGYEIPEPEKDLGKEVLYQITQQAFNELLDPLFKEKEDNAMDAFATRAERRTRAAEIDRILEEFEQKEKEANRAVVTLGEYRYASEVVEAFCNGDIMNLVREKSNILVNRDALVEMVRLTLFKMEQRVVQNMSQSPDDQEYGSFLMWSAKLYRVQLEEELVHAVVALATRVGWLPPAEAGVENTLEPTNDEVHEAVYRDPTLPQFRPNSLVDLDMADDASETTISRCSDDGRPNYLRPKFGPFFALAVEPDDVEIFSSEVPYSTKDDTPVVDTDLLTPPPPLVEQESHQEDQSQHENSSESSANAPTPPTLEPNLAFNTPTMQLLSIDPNTHKLRTNRGQSHMHYSMEPLARLIRFEALNNQSSPLHLPFLASLEPVDREISERKGSGLLNFDEFQGFVRAVRLRFLESWMDWVSF